MHAADHRSPGGFEGRRVVVVGAGNSAVQIAAELAGIATVTLATRVPVEFARRRTFGRDLHFWLHRTGLDIAPLGRLLREPPAQPVLDDGRYRTALERGRPDRRPLFTGFDGPLTFAILLLAVAGLLTMYSVGFDHGTRFVDHGRNMLIALGILFVVAQVPPQKLMALALPLYALGVGLLIATAIFGITKKGATRWLNVGMVIQPSEMLKIATPLMLAWWFQKREGQLRAPDFVVGALILALPVGLIMKQPDLGTAILVASAGLYVLFFAGLAWRLILPLIAIGAIAITALVASGDAICEPGVKWPVLREYQKHRVCTLLDPSKDPLGKGFHTIQGMIAIGSGGVEGKGFMKGTQTHLEFIPERTTDFIFAAYAEEFGLAGAVVLLCAFLFVILRGLVRTQRLVRLRVGVPDTPGSLVRIASIIAERGGNVVDVDHQRAFSKLSVKQADVDFTVETRTAEHAAEIAAALQAADFPVTRLDDGGGL